VTVNRLHTSTRIVAMRCVVALYVMRVLVAITYQTYTGYYL
jgi:hypothetical protein